MEFFTGKKHHLLWVSSCQNRICWGQRDLRHSSGFQFQTRIVFSLSRLDVAHMKRHPSDREKSDVEPEQNAHRLADFPPRNLFGEEQLPDVQVIAQEPVFEFLEEWNLLQDEIDEHE